MIEVTAFPRVHIALLDLGRVTRRAFGGAGVMVNGCAVRASARPTRDSVVRVDTSGSCDSELVRSVGDAVERLRQYLGFRHGVAVRISQAIPQHIGMGSKTASVLASLTATAHAVGADVERRVLQSLSARGGASGVGVHGYFDGGVIVDAGHPTSQVTRLVPSRYQSPQNVPLLIAHCSFPSTWRVWLVLPKGKRYSGHTERGVFESGTPIGRGATLKSIACIYHGVLPAVLESDLPLMREALAELQETGFKRVEVHSQAPRVKTLMSALQAISTVAVGMSSMGPLLYVVSERDDAASAAAINAVAASAKATVHGPFGARNSGYRIGDAPIA